MALDIIWSKKAASGYADMLLYLDQSFTVKEVENFEQEMRKFFKILSQNPYILSESQNKGYRRGPVNQLTMLTYKVDEKRNQIQLLSIRSARQNRL